ncbi:beta subunit of citrate lyase [Podospora didyma]|uniref:Beta subunit of citrate lyase n=1 Tax=Podospora didyma TaxID=330526 RepID=A0AAE0P7T4_9PEZI|nr:beta subunit of citrate lyase [Podospora didyma]
MSLRSLGRNSSPIVRRALLYVPASSEKMIRKSFNLTCDNVTYDLEDSVTDGNKEHARERLVNILGERNSLAGASQSVGELAVRINPPLTQNGLWDLTSVAKIGCVSTIVVSKVNQASDLAYVAQVAQQARPAQFPPLKLIALIESARGIMELSSICSRTDSLDGLIIGLEDLALDLSVTRTPDLSEFLYARSAIVTAARAFGVQSVIDMVCTDYMNDKVLREECQNGKRMGFNGKQVINPRQIDIVQDMFSPSEVEIEWATRVSIASEKAKRDGRGAWTLDGEMIDAPVEKRAQRLLDLAKQCRISIENLREKWKGQEPE